MATSVTRPVSLLPLPYGPGSCGASTQRPFSLAFPNACEPRTRRRPTSASGSSDIHHSAMGFNIKDRIPARIRKASGSRPGTPVPEVDNIDENDSPQRNRFLTGSLKRVKKKRSISSVFTINGDAAGGNISSPISVGADELASTPPLNIRRVSVVPEGDAERHVEESPDVFRKRDHFLTRRGMKHHPYPDEAPYMQAYDPILIDKYVEFFVLSALSFDCSYSDRYTNQLLHRLNSNGSPTFHDYGATPPTNVLDLGCGGGHWVMEAATSWRDSGTKVTGFDLVDIATHTWEIDESLLDHITWVQGNLYVLPSVFSFGSILMTWLKPKVSTSILRQFI